MGSDPIFYPILPILNSGIAIMVTHFSQQFFICLENGKPCTFHFHPAMKQSPENGWYNACFPTFHEAAEYMNKWMNQDIPFHLWENDNVLRFYGTPFQIKRIVVTGFTDTIGG